METSLKAKKAGLLRKRLPSEVSMSTAPSVLMSGAIMSESRLEAHAAQQILKYFLAFAENGFRHRAH